MINSVKTELKIWLYTGRIFIIIILIFGLFVAFAVASISVLQGRLNGFEFSQNQISDDERMWEILNAPIISKEEGVNTLLLKKMEIEGILSSLKPQNALEFCEEVGIYILPILMAAIGAVAVCSDCSSNIIRIRIAREGKWQYFFAKQIVMLTASIIATFVAILMFTGISSFTFSQATGLVTSKFIVVSAGSMVSYEKRVVGILFFAFCITAFCEIGFCFGYIFKNAIFPVCLCGFLWYFNMMPTIYEPKNAVYNIAVRLYPFKGAVPNGIGTEIPFLSAVLIVLLLILLPFSLVLLLWGKRGFYKA